jgi:hypothetical protein
MKKLGRAFNHVEDLTFFYGSAGAIEALQHIKEINEDTSSVRMKWDGGLQIYWGREYVNGPLILAGHNGWSRGIKTSSKDDLFDFIANKSGNPKTNEEKINRKLFAANFASLYYIFDNATPVDFVGFVYGDALFTEHPTVDNDTYNLYPNNKTGYHIDQYSILGLAIEDAEVMVVGHAYFPEFGMADDTQVPKDDFSEFVSNELIILGPHYATTQSNLPKDEIIKVEQYIIEHASLMDGFLEPIKGVSAFKDYLYRYTNFKAKNHQLETLGEGFVEWMHGSKISHIQQQKIINRMHEYQGSITIMFNLVKYIIQLKNEIIEQLGSTAGDITTSNSEGWVRYSNKQFGNIKLVPRHRWLP